MSNDHPKDGGNKALLDGLFDKNQFGYSVFVNGHQLNVMPKPKRATSPGSATCPASTCWPIPGWHRPSMTAQ